MARRLFGLGIAALVPLLGAAAAHAQQDCELNGRGVNPANGATTAGKTGLLRCKDRASGELQREEQVQNGVSMGLVRIYEKGKLAKEHSVNAKGNIQGRAREFSPTAGCCARPPTTTARSAAWCAASTPTASCAGPSSTPTPATAASARRSSSPSAGSCRRCAAPTRRRWRRWSTTPSSAASRAWVRRRSSCSTRRATCARGWPTCRASACARRASTTTARPRCSTRPWATSAPSRTIRPKA
jgi:hypothetical protein